VGVATTTTSIAHRKSSGKFVIVSATSTRSRVLGSKVDEGAKWKWQLSIFFSQKSVFLILEIEK
jgi:hypothetical protein